MKSIPSPRYLKIQNSSSTSHNVLLLQDSAQTRQCYPVNSDATGSEIVTRKKFVLFPVVTRKFIMNSKIPRFSRYMKTNVSRKLVQESEVSCFFKSMLDLEN